MLKTVKSVVGTDYNSILILAAILNDWSPGSEELMSYADIIGALKEDFKNMRNDLQHLISRMEVEGENFTFGKNGREYEFLCLIMKDEMLAWHDELGVAIENRDWHDVMQQIDNLQNLWMLLDKIRQRVFN